MRVVIDIDEDYINIIKKYGSENYLEDAVLFGMPLPKRHGPLKDEDEIIRCIENRVNFLRENDALFMRLHKDIDILGCIPYIRQTVPTIIGADKE